LVAYLCYASLCTGTRAGNVVGSQARLREGQPGALAETVAAISQVETHALREEQQRVQIHRQRFRLHTRSAKRSQAQLKNLVHRWRALPAARVPE